MSTGRGGGASAPLGGPPTPRRVFLNRRQILRGLGATAAWSVGACLPRGPARRGVPAFPYAEGFEIERSAVSLPPAVTRREVTPRETAARHNNYYELLPGRAGDLWSQARHLRAVPWRLEVGGACRKPRVYDLDDLLRFPHQERLYHFRCVERWAMNVPWVGFPLRLLVEEVEPTASARWLVFTSAQDADRMPGLAQAPYYPWPYREALRLDEAMHDLTLMATGLYGEPLPKQHGAPVRLVVPWKYGYKSAKAVVSIELVDRRPSTFWSEVAPHEYGLLSNVNPNVSHPRWSQELSFWLRDDPVWPTGDDTFPTPIFNGYEEQVAALYPDEPRTPQPLLRQGEIAR